MIVSLLRRVGSETPEAEQVFVVPVTFELCQTIVNRVPTVDNEQVDSFAIGQTFTKQWKYMTAVPLSIFALSLRKAN